MSRRERFPALRSTGDMHKLIKEKVIKKTREVRLNPTSKDVDSCTREMSGSGVRGDSASGTSETRQ